MKRLIVSADDFGLARSINEGIVKARRDGIVTFVNIMPTGEAFEDAICAAKELHLKEVGAHLSLTETRPCLAPDKIPSLIAKDGKFYKNHNDFFIKFLLKTIRHKEVYAELKEQVNRLKDAGMKVAALSSHEHIHIIPEMLEIFIRLAKECGIRSIRYPHRETLLGKFDIASRYKSLIMAYFDKKMNKVLNGSGLLYAEHFLGFLDSGKLSEDKLVGMLGSLREGVTELVSHPGFLGPEVLDRYRWHVNCESELAALTSKRVKTAIEKNNIRLISYRDLISGADGES